jgi:spoIIIJ-associated protein
MSEQQAGPDLATSEMENAPDDVVDTDEAAASTEAEAQEPTPETETRTESEMAETEEGDDEDDSRPSRRQRLEQEGEIAADYLEELLEIADLDGDLDMDVEGDRATVSIVGAELPELIGGDGQVLEALQELTRLAVYRETGERSRLMLDVSGYRTDRRRQLEQVATEVVARVQESGERAELDPMSPFERKVVHDVVAAAGLASESEGVEPRRYVVVRPA